MVIIAALLAVLAVPTVQAAEPPDIQQFKYDNEFEPELSAQVSAACGFPVEATVTGVVSVITRTTNEGLVEIVQPQSVVVVYTNPATGETLTLRLNIQFAETVTVEPGTVTLQLLFRGLGFLILEEDGATVSAGRRDLLVELTLDEQGNVIGVTQTILSNTPNLEGFAGEVCPRLAA
jgi:hypothetical protein